MLELDLAALERQRSIDVSGAWSLDDVGPVGNDLELVEPVEVTLDASLTATGQVLVRGQLTATVGLACRRCLEPVRVTFDVDVALVFEPASDDAVSDEDDGEIRAIDPRRPELDLSGALREEMALVAPRYAVCDSACRGLCPQCGINRNEAECECSAEEPDPRWETLRALTNK